MANVAFAVAAHPDDVEFMMAGTLLLLGRAGCELHCMNVANGSCGSVCMTRDETVRTRTQEGRNAAAALGATFHEPLVDDIQIYYTPDLVAKLAAIVRRVNPQILLLPSPQDYMEDHANASRLAVTAAFCRGMPNFPTDPPSDAVQGDVGVYHTMPCGLRDPLGAAITPDFCVDISAVLAQKREALACHSSQKEWLNQSQGLDSYLRTMEDMSAEVGRMSAQTGLPESGFAYAEGWRRRLHLGFGPEGFDPLADALDESLIATLQKGKDP